MTDFDTAVSAPTFGDTGYTAPEDEDIYTGVKSDLNTAFGGDLNFDSDGTPQQQLAASETAIISHAYDVYCSIANGVDPSYASGRMQDAIGRIYFITRKAATATTVTATCTGSENTDIPAQTLAKTTDGYVYSCVSGGTIPSSGSIDLEFECTTVGAIECPAGTLTTIYQAISGWDSITNADAGTVGRATETRTEFETRRQDSVSWNAAGFPAAIRGAVLSVDGVSGAYVYANNTSSAITKGSTSYSIAAHSLYVAAVDGDDDDVAAAIFTRLNPGCATVGNTTVTVEDSNDSYTTPYPSYEINFERPTATPIYIAVTIPYSTSVPNDAETQIQDAIVDAFSGGDGGTTPTIGSTIYSLRFVSPCAALGTWAVPQTLYIGTSSSPTGASVEIGIDEYPTITSDNITVTVSS